MSASRAASPVDPVPGWAYAWVIVHRRLYPWVMPDGGLYVMPGHSESAAGLIVALNLRASVPVSARREA